MALTDIVVGLDGSESAADALHWAYGFTHDHAASLRAISTWQVPLVASIPSLIGTLPSQAYMANYCSEALDKSLAESGLAGQVDQEIREGHAGEILVEASAVADLVVIGRTGAGRRGSPSRLVDLVMGSTARYCNHHAQGPIATIPKGRRWVPDPTVIVGVDGSEASHGALAWALENLPATATIYALRAVPPYLDGLLAFDHAALERILDATDRELDTSIRSVTAPLGDAAIRRVEPLVLLEHPRYALLDPGFDVDLIVVGERGKGAVASRLLGSVSEHATRHATCPVVLVPLPGENSE